MHLIQTYVPNMKAVKEHHSFVCKDIVSKSIKLILSMTEGLKRRTLQLLDKVLNRFTVIRKQVSQGQSFFFPSAIFSLKSVYIDILDL